MNDLVSVIITTYKGEENICRAVESVLGQTYKSIEIIVVDDNGKGTIHQISTEKNLQNYIERGLINYIPHENNINGSAARNTGVRYAKGSFICLLDDDDEFLPSKIELQLKRFAELPAEFGMMYCSFHVYEANNYEQDVIACKEGDISIPLLLGEMRIASSLLMIKKEAYCAISGFDESFNRHQDWEFIVRFCQQYKVSYVPDVCVNKYMLERNTPKSGELTEKYRLYYLSKMNPIIRTFPTEIQEAIFSKFYLEIAKTYFLCKEYKQFWIFAKRVHNRRLVGKMVVRETLKPVVKKVIGRLQHGVKRGARI